MLDLNGPITCSCGPLVYVRTLKCASTFFWHSFRNKFGWSDFRFDQVAWNQQRVFSHIMDPKIRRVKGVTEFVWMHQTQHLLKESHSYRTFVQQTPVLDKHTESMYENFGNYCDRIDWIPIDMFDHQTVADLTSLMLFDHGVKIFNRWDWAFEHASPPEKKLLEQQVTECLAEVDTPAVDEYLARDHELYRRVVNKFNPDAGKWAEVTWLRLQ